MEELTEMTVQLWTSQAGRYGIYDTVNVTVLLELPNLFVAVTKITAGIPAFPS
jgi:hypothetical protein